MKAAGFFRACRGWLLKFYQTKKNIVALFDHQRSRAWLSSLSTCRQSGLCLVSSAVPAVEGQSQEPGVPGTGRETGEGGPLADYSQVPRCTSDAVLLTACSTPA